MVWALMEIVLKARRAASRARAESSGTLRRVALARVPGRHAAGELRHPWITPRDIRRVAEVEHRRTLLRPVRPVVEGPERPIPEIVGDAEVAGLIVEVMGH